MCTSSWSQQPPSAPSSRGGSHSSTNCLERCPWEGRWGRGSVEIEGCLPKIHNPGKFMLVVPNSGAEALMRRVRIVSVRRRMSQAISVWLICFPRSRLCCVPLAPCGPRSPLIMTALLPEGEGEIERERSRAEGPAAEAQICTSLLPQKARA